VSPLDPETPPRGEEVHLPGPTIVPLLTAVGVTLLLVGITTYIELVIAGALLTLYCIGRWIRESRKEFDELPLDGGEH
jgi:hypothetical protein